MVRSDISNRCVNLRFISKGRQSSFFLLLPQERWLTRVILIYKIFLHVHQSSAEGLGQWVYACSKDIWNSEKKGYWRHEAVHCFVDRVCWGRRGQSMGRSCGCQLRKYSNGLRSFVLSLCNTYLVTKSWHKYVEERYSCRGRIVGADATVPPPESRFTKRRGGAAGDWNVSCIMFITHRSDYHFSDCCN